MPRFSTQSIGLAALAVYALGSLLGLLNILHLVPISFGYGLGLVITGATIVLALMWAISYWWSNKSRGSILVLVLVGAIVLENVIVLAQRVGDLLRWR